jgi:hypothetical protein
MYTCLDCGKTFDEPKWYKERHGFVSRPYEEFWGCPYCGGNYVSAVKCDGCGEYIADYYIKTKHNKRYCENCYILYQLGDED